uniref:ubiquitinyl hydrolase 1 n=1 Tax=Chromera velia CCMP2878 TaxID=1169474 RepID=A0A0G4HGM2_9ALVE|eukprot:Cvel_27383.t1-p1 / transcript=Cvel_27383.t1 / gene=Cvel_27383 / organism=Chromera_velia_CCMP2878 / gene_product=Ubiquitin carboxyl-terminal hydrolase 10, putative / transcript_product=Ubiquitin carboxyl-terminal hydrolase 10, putative / location=Cvel_scaffold3408:1274-9805(-) / protein_length=890 / sequence_SO=supercontig / SO=protein_coding / is_pseudo=false
MSGNDGLTGMVLLDEDDSMDSAPPFKMDAHTMGGGPPRGAPPQGSRGLLPEQPPSISQYDHRAPPLPPSDESAHRFEASMAAQGDTPHRGHISDLDHYDGGGLGGGRGDGGGDGHEHLHHTAAPTHSSAPWHNSDRDREKDAHAPQLNGQPPVPEWSHQQHHHQGGHGQRPHHQNQFRQGQGGPRAHASQNPTHHPQGNMTIQQIHGGASSPPGVGPRDPKEKMRGDRDGPPAAFHPHPHGNTAQPQWTSQQHSKQGGQMRRDGRDRTDGPPSQSPQMSPMDPDYPHQSLHPNQGSRRRSPVSHRNSDLSTSASVSGAQPSSPLPQGSHGPPGAAPPHQQGRGAAPPTTKKSGSSTVPSQSPLPTTNGVVHGQHGGNQQQQRPVGTSPTAAGGGDTGGKGKGRPPKYDGERERLAVPFVNPERPKSVSILDALLAMAVHEKLARHDKLMNPGENSTVDGEEKVKLDWNNKLLKERHRELSEYAKRLNTPVGNLWPDACFILNTTFARYAQRGVRNVTSVHCYINAVLQALLACSPLMKLLSHNACGSKVRPIFRSLTQFSSNFFGGYKDPTNKGINPRQIHQIVDPEMDLDPMYSLWNKHCERFGQQDAGEFLIWLLEHLQEECSWAIGKKGDKGGQGAQGGGDFDVVGKSGKKLEVREHASEKDSPISRIFGSVIRRHLYNEKNSGMYQSNDEWFNVIHLMVSDEKISTLEDSLDKFFEPEQVEVGQGKDAKTKWAKYEIKRPPMILVLNLKRVFWDTKHKRSGKVQRFIKYPPTLTLKDTWMDQNSKVAAASPPQYHLFAVVGHHGHEADEGHFNAYVRFVLNNKDPESKGGVEWISYDDTKVRRMEGGEWLRAHGAYLLFYVIPRARTDIRPGRDGEISWEEPSLGR